MDGSAARLAPYIYILPATLFMFIFVGIPILMSVYMSFFRIESVNSDWIFAGFSNFSDVFTRNDFGPAMLRTLVLAVFSVITTLGGGLLLANMVAHHKWLNFYRYIFYVPTVVSAITMGRLWSMMLMPSASGLMNTFIRNVSACRRRSTGWRSRSRYTWSWGSPVGVGGGMTLILFTTAINDISQEIREAAILDGINGWQMLWRITVPMIWPVISSWTILSIIGSFKSFEFIYALSRRRTRRFHPNHRHPAVRKQQDQQQRLRLQRGDGAAADPVCLHLLAGVYAHLQLRARTRRD